MESILLDILRPAIKKMLDDNTRQVTQQVTQQITRQVTEQVLSGVYKQLRGNKEALSSLQDYVLSLNLPEDQQAKYIALFESDDGFLDEGK